MTTATLHYAAATLTKAASDGKGIVEMLASMDIVDRQGEVIDLPAWEDDVKSFRRGTIELLIDHDPELVCGALTEVHLEPRGLFVVAQLNMSGDLGRKTYEALLRAKTEDMPGVSVGFEAIEAKTINGVRHITKARLREVSILLTLAPALPTARVLNVKGGAQSLPSEAELRRRIAALEAHGRTTSDVHRELSRVERLVGLGHHGDGLGGVDGLRSGDGSTTLS